VRRRPSGRQAAAALADAPVAWRNGLSNAAVSGRTAAAARRAPTVIILGTQARLELLTAGGSRELEKEKRGKGGMCAMAMTRDI